MKGRILAGGAQKSPEPWVTETTNRESERERALGGNPFSASGGVGSHPIFGMLESVDVNPATVLFVPAVEDIYSRGACS